MLQFGRTNAVDGGLRSDPTVGVGFSVGRIMLVEVQRSGLPVVVDEVPDEFVLQLAAEAEVKAREADRSKLRLGAGLGGPARRGRSDEGRALERCGPA